MFTYTFYRTCSVEEGPSSYEHSINIKVGDHNLQFEDIFSYRHFILTMHNAEYAALKSST